MQHAVRRFERRVRSQGWIPKGHPGRSSTMEEDDRKLTGGPMVIESSVFDVSVNSQPLVIHSKEVNPRTAEIVVYRRGECHTVTAPR